MRPFRRRAARMARPARVLIRWRNPWVLARRRLLGWNVRLLTLLDFRRVEAGSTSGLRLWRGHLRDPPRVRPVAMTGRDRQATPIEEFHGIRCQQAKTAGQGSRTRENCVWPDCTTVRERAEGGQTSAPQSDDRYTRRGQPFGSRHAERLTIHARVGPLHRSSDDPPQPPAAGVVVSCLWITTEFSPNVDDTVDRCHPCPCRPSSR